MNGVSERKNSSALLDHNSALVCRNAKPTLAERMNSALLLVVLLASSARASNEISYTQYGYYGPELPADQEAQICSNETAFRVTHMGKTVLDTCICDKLPDPEPRCRLYPKDANDFILIQYDKYACSGPNKKSVLGKLNTWYVCTSLVNSAQTIVHADMHAYVTFRVATPLNDHRSYRLPSRRFAFCHPSQQRRHQTPELQPCSRAQLSAER